MLERTEGVLDDPGPWVYVAELAPSSVNFDVYFWVESKQANVLEVKDRVATGVKLALDEAGIDMPYPHTVVLFHDSTGTRQGDSVGETFAVRQKGGEPRETSTTSPARRVTGGQR